MKWKQLTDRCIDAPPPRGGVQLLDLGGLGREKYYRYLPWRLRSELSPLVFVHGYSRRAARQVQTLTALSERTGRALLAPLFDADCHPRYQRLAKGATRLRADLVLDACLAELATSIGSPAAGCVLIGYSGGAQFGHRYAMVHPERVDRLVAIAAGWYTFPCAETRYPYGLAATAKLRGVTMDPEAFLRVPMTVIVGAEDLDFVNLRSNPELDRWQGKTRVERARHWVVAMRMAARRYRTPCDIDYLELPGIRHSFAQLVTKGHLLELIGAAVADTGSTVTGFGNDETERAVA